MGARSWGSSHLPMASAKTLKLWCSPPQLHPHDQTERKRIHEKASQRPSTVCEPYLSQPFGSGFVWPVQNLFFSPSECLLKRTKAQRSHLPCWTRLIKMWVAVEDSRRTSRCDCVILLKRTKIFLEKKEPLLKESLETTHANNQFARSNQNHVSHGNYLSLITGTRLLFSFVNIWSLGGGQTHDSEKN